MTCTVCGQDFFREVKNDPPAGTFETKFTHSCPLLVAMANDNRDLRAAIVEAALRQKKSRGG